MDIFSELGELAIGSRLRRLSDYIMQEGVETYQNYRIDFDPKWFPVYYLLSKKEQMSIMEITANLSVSHPAVIKNARELEAKGYIESAQDPQDKRRRLLRLSAEGRHLLPIIQEAWKDIAGSLAQVISEQESHLLQAIVQVEQAFRQEPFTARVRKFRDTRLLQAIEIVDYHPDYGSYFKAFNYSWIERYFSVEPVDITVLEQHQEKIIAPGGYILFAKLDGLIVGTCALKKNSAELYELTKMAVTESAQGKQVGKKLGLAVLERAKQIGAKTVFLESNRKLTPALNLYRRLGFQEVPHAVEAESEYMRSDIRMEIKV